MKSIVELIDESASAELDEQLNEVDSLVALVLAIAISEEHQRGDTLSEASKGLPSAWLHVDVLDIMNSLGIGKKLMKAVRSGIDAVKRVLDPSKLMKMLKGKMDGKDQYGRDLKLVKIDELFSSINSVDRLRMEIEREIKRINRRDATK